jgi:hypothetical protein
VGLADWVARSTSVSPGSPGHTTDHNIVHDALNELVPMVLTGRLSAASLGSAGIPAGYEGTTADPTGVVDATTQFNDVLADGGALYVAPGTYRCLSQLLVDTNSKIYLAPGARIVKAYVSGTTSNASFIRTRSLTGGTGYYNAIQPSHDVLIHGPGEISGDFVQRATDGAITSGTATLTSTTANWLTTDVGRGIRIPGAGASGATLDANITARNSPTSVTISVTASTTVSGATLTHVGTGNLICIGGDRFTALDFRTTFWDGGQHTIGVGDDWLIMGTRFTGGDLSTVNDGVRFMGGKRFLGIGIHCDSGDDTFQFVPGGTFTDPLFNVTIEDSLYIGCSGSSSSARLIVSSLQDQNNNGTLGMTSSIRRSGFIGITGKSGGASMVFQNASSTGSILDNYAAYINIDASDNIGTGQPAAMYFNAYSGTGDIVGTLVQKATIRGSHKKGLEFERGGRDTTIMDCIFERGTLTDSSIVAHIGGVNTRVIRCKFDGKTTSTLSIINVNTSQGFVPSRIFIQDCEILNIPDAAFGIDVITGTDVLIGPNNYFGQKTSNNNTAQAYRAAASTTGGAWGNLMGGLTATTKYTNNAGPPFRLGVKAAERWDKPTYKTPIDVTESGGSIPLRSAVSDDATQPIHVFSSINPFLTHGYIVGVDKWAEPV